MSTNFFRVGAGAAMVGTVIGVIFNLLHPRSADAFESVEGELQMIADSDIWKFDHIMLAVSIAIGAVGFIAIALSMANTAGDAWARTAALFGTASAGVMMVLIGLDGIPVKDLADRWAAGDETITGAATALVEINFSLLGIGWILFFGITPLLFGQAFLSSGSYPANLGYADMIGGLLGLLTGFLLLFETATSFAATILIPVSSLIVTIVLFIAGWLLWNKPATTTPAALTHGGTAAT